MRLIVLCFVLSACAENGERPGQGRVRPDVATRWVPRTEEDFLKEPVDIAEDNDRDACRRAVPQPTEHVDEYMACLTARRAARATALAQKKAKDQEEADRRYEEGAAVRQAERDRENTARELEAKAWADKRKQEQEAFDAQVAADQAAEEAGIEALKKKCGNDYMRVEVGMKWKRVKECAGEFHIKIDDPQFQVYEGIGGLVTVQGGVVRRVVRR